MATSPLKWLLLIAFLDLISSNELSSCGSDDQCPFKADNQLLQSARKMKLDVHGTPERCFSLTTDAQADCAALAGELKTATEHGCSGNDGAICKYQDKKLQGDNDNCEDTVQESGFICKLCWEPGSWLNCVDPPSPVGPPLTFKGKDPKGPLEVCTGDCDKDSDCADGLKCFERKGYTAVPGCSGIVGEGEDDAKGYDYCYDPNMPLLPSLNDVAENPKEKLDECAGDCDNDSNCKTGLACYQRDGYMPVPGCSGQGQKNWDYCYSPVLNDGGLDPSGTELGRCTGDCDKDSGCLGDLKCFQRDGFTPVPGCAGKGMKDWDYCYDDSNPN